MTEYSKQLKEDSVKSQIVIGYYRDKKSSYELSREFGIPARTVREFRVW